MAPGSELKAWEVVNRQKVTDVSPWLQLWAETVYLPDGRRVDDFYTLELPDYVVVFAIDEQERILGLWHYKHGPRCVTLGLPAGYVEPEEPLLEAAQRELLEETGYVGNRWQHLGSFVVDGNRRCGQAHLYLAQELRRVKLPDTDDLEETHLVYVTLQELAQFLGAGRIGTLGAAAAIGLALNALATGSMRP